MYHRFHEGRVQDSNVRARASSRSRLTQRLTKDDWQEPRNGLAGDHASRRGRGCRDRAAGRHANGIRSVVRLLCALALLGAMSACDPESLVKRKVPEPVKSALTFTEQGPAGGGAPAIAGSLRITSPEKNQLFAINSRVAFQADLKIQGSNAVSAKDVTWTLVNRSTPKKSVPLGRGPKVSRRVEQGSFLVQASLTLPNNRKLTDKVTFSVAPALQGYVVYNNAGLAGAKLTLMDPREGKEIAEAKSGPTGSFAIEIPAEGSFVLKPQKAGFSFAPISQVVQYGDDPNDVVFGAAKGELKNIRLTADAQDDQPLGSVCPNDEVFLKLEIVSEDPVTGLDAELVDEVGTRAPLLLAQVNSPGAVPNTGDRNQPQSLKVRVPLGPQPVPAEAAYYLRVTVYDEKGNAFADRAPHRIRVDIPACLDSMVAAAVAAQEAGRLEQAIQSYGSVESVGRSIDRNPAVSRAMEIAAINKALAYLQQAANSQTGGSQPGNDLAPAISALRDAVDLNDRNPVGHFLRGMALYLLGRPREAVKSYTAAIAQANRFADAHRFRGIAYLATRERDNLMPAVDDFTRALDLGAEPSGLRQARRAALELALQEQEPKDQSLDTSQALEPVRDLRPRFEGYLQK